MTLRPIGICLVVASTLLSGGALAEGAGQDATTITANYGVYWAGLRFGNVRLDITVSGSRYKMKGSGRFQLWAASSISGAAVRRAPASSPSQVLSHRSTR